MFTAYVIITVLTAVANAGAAAADFIRPKWIQVNMTRLGVPHSWLFPLGTLKAAGALGLMVGFAVPVIGVAAAVGLILFFAGAILTALRARWYAHLPTPTAYLLLAVAALVSQVAT